MSMYSNTSSGPGLPRNLNSAAQQSSQVSTTTLLNAIHTIYTSGQPFPLDASTSLVVNTWLTASQPDQEGRTGGTVDGALSARAWEHARRRAEDGCIVLGYVFPPPQRLILTVSQISPRFNSFGARSIPGDTTAVYPVLIIHGSRCTPTFHPFRITTKPFYPSTICSRSNINTDPRGKPDCGNFGFVRRRN
jgi:hypothetical protein